MKPSNATDEKIKSIEQTVAKNNVRTNIHRQIEEYVYADDSNSLNIATLAAQEWFFEYGLLNHLNHSLILSDCPECNFVSAEKDKQTAMTSFVNMPDNATVLKGLFSDIFDKPWKTSKTGFSYITNDPEDVKNTKYNVVWADYCSYANTQLLKDFVNVVENNMDKGLIYLTFCLSERRGAHQTSLKDLKQYSKSNDIIKATSDAIKTFSKRINKTKKITKVFEVIYGGGASSGTAMVTIGFGVNLTKDSITPLYFDDSEWKSDKRMVRQATVHNRLSKKGGWTIKKMGRKKKKYKSTNPLRILKAKEKKEWESVKRKIFVRADRGWDTNKIYTDLEETLAPLGKTPQSVSSVLAWRSPKLAKKKVK